MKRSVGILLFDDVEVLDFAGPFEVFAVASQIHDGALFDVFTIGKDGGEVRAVNGLRVVPDRAIASVERLDVLVVPGGVGSRQLIESPETLEWTGRIHATSEITMTVCTGSRVLAKLGLLEGQPYCTHQGAYGNLAELAPTGIPCPDKRFVQTGKIWTSGGISAGIDLALHIVGVLHGEDVAQRTADYMEYRMIGT